MRGRGRCRYRFDGVGGDDRPDAAETGEPGAVYLDGSGPIGCHEGVSNSGGRGGRGARS